MSEKAWHGQAATDATIITGPLAGRVSPTLSARTLYTGSQAATTSMPIMIISLPFMTVSPLSSGLEQSIP